MIACLCGSPSHAQTDKSCDSFNQPAKKLIAHLAASFAKAHKEGA